jgi:hypothetical protein
VAQRNTPTDGKRFQRAKPSGNHKRKRRSPIRSIDTKHGETLLDDEMAKKIVALIRAGNYIEVAARACGIDKHTLFTWLRKGAEGIAPYASLNNAVEKAAAEAEAFDVARVGQHGSKHWQAAAWRLERKNPRRWGRKDSIELSIDDEKPAAARSSRIDPSRLSAEERAVFDQLRAKMRVDEDEPIEREDE